MGTVLKKLFLKKKKVEKRKLIIGVDLNLFLFKYLAVYKTENLFPFTHIVDGSSEITSHLYGIFKKFGPLSEKVEFIFLIDWNRNELPLKEEVRKKRKEAIQENNEKIKRFSSDQSTLMLAQKYLSRKTDYDINYSLLERIMNEVGWTYIKITDTEAEAAGAKMVAEGKIDYFYTNDSDCLLFGSDYLTDLTENRKDGSFELTITSLNDTLRERGLTEEELISCAVVAGTDYSKGIPMVGPIKSLKLIKDPSFELPPELKKIKEYFLKRPPSPSFQNTNFNKECFISWKKKLGIDQ
jgi:5'-3' exonuclease